MAPDDLLVLTGAPGSWKTAVLQALGRDVERVPEPAREILAQQRATGGDATPDRDPSRFVELLLARAIERYERSSRNGVVTVFDRGIPDRVAYAEILDVDPSASISASLRYRYRPTVLIFPPWEEIYATDDERRMSFGDIVPFHEAIVAAYEASGYTLVDVPPAPIDVRASFVREHVDRRRRDAPSPGASPRVRPPNAAAGSRRRGSSLRTPSPDG